MNKKISLILAATPHPPTEKIIHLCIVLWILVQSYTVNDLILFGGQCDLYIMIERFCLVSLTISNRKTSYRSLKANSGLDKLSVDNHSSFTKDLNQRKNVFLLVCCCSFFVVVVVGEGGGQG